jgi:hypothetical protein
MKFAHADTFQLLLNQHMQFHQQLKDDDDDDDETENTELTAEQVLDKAVENISDEVRNIREIYTRKRTVYLKSHDTIQLNF